MTDKIIGMMFNHNEADILPDVIEAALSKVDALFIADDGSTDNSWDIIKSYESKCELIAKRDRNPKDKGQRTFLLNEIRRAYKPENTWVQIIESDIIILDTDIRKAIKDHAVHDLAMSWMCLNAAREAGTWQEVDTWPNWTMPVQELMPKAHWMEFMLYSYRPLPKLYFDPDTWRPWPRGFSFYTDQQVKGSYGRKPSAPLLLHVGYRGPTHFYNKYKDKWSRHPKYKDWIIESPQTVEDTVYYFNGKWNRDLFPASRKGWVAWRRG